MKLIRTIRASASLAVLLIAGGGNCQTPSTAETAIRPFTIKVPDATLRDLQERLAKTRWPDAAPRPRKGSVLDIDTWPT